MRALALCALLLGCGPTAPPPSTPREDVDRFVSHEGQFSVLFPCKPQLSSKPVETSAGTFTIHEIGCAVLTGDRGAYTVSYADVPFEGMVDVMRKIAATPPRVLIRERPAEIVSGVRGYEVEFEEEQLGKTGRFFQLGPRYYQVLVEYPKTARPSGTRRFLESFRFEK